MEKLYPGLIDNVLQQKLAENPENLLVILIMADRYHKMHKYQEAVDMCEKAVFFKRIQCCCSE